MRFLVDTDICSAHLKDTRTVVSRFLQYTGRLHLSAVTVGELDTWTMRSKASPRHQKGLTALLGDVTVLDVDHEVARKFGEVHAHLLDQGLPIAGMDLLIAATALVHGLTLVPHNIRDFSSIPGLTVVDWLRP